MRRDHDRFAPGKIPMRVTIQVNDVGTEAGRKIEEPLACSIHVIPWSMLPFEREFTLGEHHLRNFQKLLLLRLRRARAHGRDEKLCSTFNKRCNEVDRVLPHSTNCVGGYEYFQWRSGVSRDITGHARLLPVQ